MALLLTALSIPVRADDSERIDELQARIEAMEAQNQRLLRALEAKGADAPLAGDEAEASTTLTALEAAKAAEKAPEWYEVGSDTKMTATWKNGLEIESKNHDFRVHVGGRTQLDFGWFNADASVQDSLPTTGRFRDGVDFRRGRFRIDGTMYETMEWVAEFDFVNSAGAGPAATPISVVAPTDLWWQWNAVPVMQNFRVGNVKEAIGFEHLTSSRFLNFMERSYMQDAFFGGFNNGFTPGAQFFGNMAEERMTYNIGVYDVTTNVFGTNVGSAEYSFTGRLTALPYYEDEGKGLLHLGVSARQWSLDEHQARFRTRASVRAGPSPQWPVVADTGLINADSNQQINVELMHQVGSFSVISEFLTSWTQKALRNGVDVGPVIYRGAYVEALYFLTGEHRQYNRKTGVIDRVVPIENAFFVRGVDGEPPSYGWGAWQLGARYQFLDLNSNGFNGGILHDTTLGINWYLNPNFKVQANYFYEYRLAGSGVGNGAVQGFGIRLAHDF